MNKCICVALVLLVTTVVFSNESRTILGSTVEIIDNENTNISMQEEVINITLHKEYYEVDVEFIFYNCGPDETILLGFPVQTILQDYPENSEWAILDDFKTFINGNILSEYITREEKSDDGTYITTKKWYLRKALFTQESHTYSKVTYRAPYNNFGFFKNAGYIFGTGRNWKNDIGKITIYINHGDDIIIDYTNNLEKFNFTWEANGKYKYEIENIEPEETASFRIFIQPFDIYGEYRNEFGDWSYGWWWDRDLMFKDETKINLYTKNQIRLLINFFYAFHGYDFKNPLYKNYFQNLRGFFDLYNTKYKINPNFSEKDFNEFERKNIDYLLKIEKMIP
jgi:hypothetical protein